MQINKDDHISSCEHSPSELEFPGAYAQLTKLGICAVSLHAFPYPNKLHPKLTGQYRPKPPTPLINMWEPIRVRNAQHIAHWLHTASVHGSLPCTVPVAGPACWLSQQPVPLLSWRLSAHLPGGSPIPRYSNNNQNTEC